MPGKGDANTFAEIMVSAIVITVNSFFIAFLYSEERAECDRL